MPKFWDIVGLIDGQRFTKFHWHRTMYVKMAFKLLLDFPAILDGNIKRVMPLPFSFVFLHPKAAQ